MKEIKSWDKVISLIPALSSEERESLKASIKKDGLRYPILHLPDGRIVDGYHRWLICQELGKRPKFEEVDINEAEAFSQALKLNIVRRQLSREQLRAIVRTLRSEGKTQEEVSEIIGLPRSTVATWETVETEGVHNDEVVNTHTSPDLRIEIPKTEYPQIFERLSKGESQEAVAADYKVDRTTISRIKSTHERELEHEKQLKELEEQTKKLPPPDRIFIRGAASGNRTHSTDPPGSRNALTLARTLRWGA